MHFFLKSFFSLLGLDHLNGGAIPISFSRAGQRMSEGHRNCAPDSRFEAYKSGQDVTQVAHYMSGSLNGS